MDDFVCNRHLKWCKVEMNRAITVLTFGKQTFHPSAVKLLGTEHFKIKTQVHYPFTGIGITFLRKRCTNLTNTTQ